MIIFPSPQTKTWTQPNSSDLFGSLWSVRGINLDRPGYLELSNASINLQGCSILKGVPIDVNALTNTSGNINGYNALTTNGVYSLVINSLQLGDRLVANTISNFPVLNSSSSDCINWQNSWQVTTDNQLKSFDGSTWTTRATVALTSNKKHAMEIMKNKNVLCITDDKKVRQYDISYTFKTDLLLNEDPISIVYASNTLGILTKNSSPQNSAYFYTWDGDASSITSTPTGVFPIGASAALGICSYQTNSWVILTSRGQLIKFNGSGFTVLAEFPWASDTRIEWTNTSGVFGNLSQPDTFSRCLYVIGDNIYINVNSSMLTNPNKENYYRQDFPSGIWCYSPSVGLYHKYNHSSRTEAITNITSINTVTDVITVAQNDAPTGSPVRYLSLGTVASIGGLTHGILYYVINLSSTTLKLAITKTNALAGISIDISGTLSSNQSLRFYAEKDYGVLSQFKNAGNSVNFVKKFIGDPIAREYSELLFSGYNDIGNATLNTIVSDVETRGTIITPRLYSKNFKDTWKKISIKYSGVTKDIDMIRVKYVDEEFPNIPGSTYGDTTFDVSMPTNTTVALNQPAGFPLGYSTVVDDVMKYLTGNSASTNYTYAAGDTKEIELTVITGPGSGCSSRINSIIKSGVNYLITLSEAIPGVIAGDNIKSSINLAIWKTIGDITSVDTDGYKELYIDTVSKFIQFKLDLRGYGVIIEEIQIINEPHTMSV